MKRPKKISWKIYFAIYAFVAILNTTFLFSPGSQMFWYYQVLVAFHPVLIIPYGLNVLSVVLNLLTLIPLYLFIADRRWLHPRLWGYFFVARLLLEFFGKSYDKNVLSSLFHNDPTSAWLSLGMVTCLMLPSYIALFLYAFFPSRKRPQQQNQQ